MSCKQINYSYEVPSSALGETSTYRIISYTSPGFLITLEEGRLLETGTLMETGLLLFHYEFVI